jgi:hypothetical protein
LVPSTELRFVMGEGRLHQVVRAARLAASRSSFWTSSALVAKVAADEADANDFAHHDMRDGLLTAAVKPVAAAVITRGRQDETFARWAADPDAALAEQRRKARLELALIERLAAGRWRQPKLAQVARRVRRDLVGARAVACSPALVVRAAGCRRGRSRRVRRCSRGAPARRSADPPEPVAARRPRGGGIA